MGGGENGADEVFQHSAATYQFEEKSPGKWYLGAMPVEPSQGFKAKEIQLLSLAKPHMRGFHCAWMSFFARRPRPAPNGFGGRRPPPPSPRARSRRSCAGSRSRRSWCSSRRT